MSVRPQRMERPSCVESWLASYIQTFRTTEYVLSGWTRETIERDGGWISQLTRITGSSPDKLLANGQNVLILFDEAQDSYWDVGLWTDFIKSLEPGVGPMLIISGREG
ncbi:hypothetical protein K440DRAFT_612628 [Wilcoxina mikolae CBS 423.85]|nr:hypothetical protein K440DRAFT_612628 [Wilcoxina mikolae CBS 423.85]